MEYSPIEYPLQNIEDCEQLKIIEHGYIIKSYPTIEYNEISLNTYEDYQYLVDKYYQKPINKIRKLNPINFGIDSTGILKTNFQFLNLRSSNLAIIINTI